MAAGAGRGGLVHVVAVQIEAHVQFIWPQVIVVDGRCHGATTATSIHAAAIHNVGTANNDIATAADHRIQAGVVGRRWQRTFCEKLIRIDDIEWLICTVDDLIAQAQASITAIDCIVDCQSAVAAVAVIEIDWIGCHI